jgi:hypothetical protein
MVLVCWSTGCLLLMEDHFVCFDTYLSTYLVGVEQMRQQKFGNLRLEPRG